MCVVLQPYILKDIRVLEAVQRRATRLNLAHKYGLKSLIFSILQTEGWRWTWYKILHGLVDLPVGDFSSKQHLLCKIMSKPNWLKVTKIPC